MEDWDPFADPADTGAEITKCVVEERDAKSIFNTRWADKAQNEALMAALLTSSMDEPTIREQEQEDSLDHGVADPPGRPGGEAKLVETQTDSPEKRQSSKPPVTGEISEAPEPRPRGRIGYQSQSKGNGKGVGGYTAWLSALDRPKPPIQETQSAQSEAPSLPGGQGAEAAEATKSTKAAVPVDAPKVEETRIMCEVDPDEMLAWRELFFKLGETEAKPMSGAGVSAPDPSGTWGSQGSLARLLKREGIDMSELPNGSASSSSEHPAQLTRPSLVQRSQRFAHPPSMPSAAAPGPSRPRMRSRRGAG